MIIGVYPPRTGLGPTALGGLGLNINPAIAQMKFRPNAPRAGATVVAPAPASGGELPADEAGAAAPPFGLPMWWKTGALAVAVGLGALLVLRKKPA